MSVHLVSRSLSRIVLAVIILAVLILSLPKPVSAAVPAITITSVKADELVTVRTSNFPKDTGFTVRMDVAGNWAIDGIVVGETNSGVGGEFEVSYRIPAELRGAKTIAIRMDSKEGYYAATWFNNRTSGTTGSTNTSPTPNPVSTSTPQMVFLEVKSNQSVTMEVRRLSPNTTFTVRVGPYYTFSRNYDYMPSVKTDSNGYVKFTFNMPDLIKNVDLVAVRLDGNGRFAYNAFRNVNSTTSSDSSVVPVTSTGACQVVSVSPGASMSTRYDFDAVWTIKNTSDKTWDGNSVDFKYVNGSKMQKHGDYFDLHQTIKSGETVKVIVDMVAPSSTGYYTTNWALVQGNNTLCSLPLTIRVK